MRKSKKNYIVVILAIVLLLGATTAFFAQVSKGNEGYRTISVVEVSGNVGVVKDGIEYKAYPGMLVREDQAIVTGGNSYVRLVLDDDKYIRMDAGSRAIFDTLGLLGSGKTRINLERGALISELVNPLGANDEYVVSTPNAVLAVRGTFFRVDLSIQESGDVLADVLTYGGQVASQRVLPTGEVIEEEVLIDAGYKATINMTEDDTHYVIDEAEVTKPIVKEDISDEDLVDIYFAAENGHELFVTAEEAKADLEKREIEIEERTSVYVQTSTEVSVKADDSKPIGKVENTKQEIASTTGDPRADGSSNRVEKEEAPVVEELVQEETPEEHPVEQHVHAYIEKEHKDPTCTVAGYDTYKCECGDGYTEEIKATGHTIINTAYVAPKCTTPGSSTYACDCGYSYVEEVAALGHKRVVEYTDGTTVSDGKMLDSCKQCSTVYAQETLVSIPYRFPDSVFAKYVSENFDQDGRASLNTAELAALQSTTELELSGPVDGDGGITNLRGIEYFTGLTTLRCSYNPNLTTLDLSKNTQLSKLEIEFTNMKNLSVANTQMDYLNLGAFSALETLDVTNTPLTHLQVASESIKALDLSTNDELVTLDVCGCHQLESLDLTKCVNLTGFRGSNTQIPLLDFSQCNNLNSLMLSSNMSLTELRLHGCSDLTSIDISSNTNLRILDVSNMAITTLDTSALSNLEILDVSNSSITALNLMNNEKITNLITTGAELSILHINSSYLNSINLTTNSQLQELNLNNCTNLQTLDLSQNNALTTFTCGASGLSSLDLSGKQNLSTLSLIQCQGLKSINFSDCTNLSEVQLIMLQDVITLNANNSALTGLVVTMLPALQELNVDNTSLTMLDVASNSELTKLSVAGTNITSLDLSNNTNLSSLGMSDTKLETLKVSSNKLTGNAINVAGAGEYLKELWVIDCENLSGLSLSSNTELTSLHCTNSGLVSIDLSENRNLVDVDVSNSRNLQYLSGLNSCRSLESVNASGTRVYALEIDYCTSLKSIDITNVSSMTYLSLSENAALQTLRVGGTGISALDITNNLNLTEIYTGGRYIAGEISFTGLRDPNIIMD